MKKEKIEDMDNMDLMRAIYKEVKETKTIVEGHTKILARHEKLLEEHTKILQKHGKILEEHTIKLENLEKVQQEHTVKLENLEVEKLHFEYVRNKFERLERKIDANFKELNNKITNIKDVIIKLDNLNSKGINDYERIVLNDLESRISILEEESETYKLN